jgi:isopentenyl-diphosphate delta-isomerase
VVNPDSDHSLRKAEHLSINLNHDVQARELTTGFENYYFVHQALPELDARSIDLFTSLLGKRLKAPVIISAMTGGTDEAQRINENLARAAQAAGVGMGVGSQRAALDDPKLARSYQVRHLAPDILLFANLGAVQLNYGYGPDHCRRAVEMIEADALVLHLNPLQEALQPGGNTDFSGLLSKIECVCCELTVPVLVKEVGWGISESVARRLCRAGVAGIDVAGAGGTVWSEVERLRAGNKVAHNLTNAFASWGIPTAESIKMVRRGAPGLPLIASGGIRHGLDAAKAIALGADAVGLAAPLLKVAYLSSEAVTEALEELARGLSLAMFCLGAPNLSALKGSPYLRVRER